MIAWQHAAKSPGPRALVRLPCGTISDAMLGGKPQVIARSFA